MTKVPERFPKIRAVYKRSNNSDGYYTVEDEVNRGFKWVFERAEEVQAIEKIHGTNVAVEIEDGRVVDAATRIGDRSMNLVKPYHDTDNHYVVRGIQNSISRGYIDSTVEGWNFGELVGPSVHGNPYDLDEHLFIPFEWLRNKCEYNSYGKYSTDFDAISEWFKNGLFSLFYSKMNGTDLDEASVTNGVFVEGIIFVHPDFDGQVNPTDISNHNSDEYESVAMNVGKLRRDMFDWYH